MTTLCADEEWESGKGPCGFAEKLKNTEEPIVGLVSNTELRVLTVLMPAVTKDFRVLVVDDDVIARKFLATMLQMDGHKVALAEEVPQAQKLAEQSGLADFDCVVTDYHMPGPSGLDFVEWLRQKDDDIAIIMITSEGRENLSKDSRLGALFEFVKKPVEGKRVREVVAKACESTRSRRSQATV